MKKKKDSEASQQESRNDGKMWEFWHLETRYLMHDDSIAGKQVLVNVDRRFFLDQLHKPFKDERMSECINEYLMDYMKDGS